MEKLYNYGQVKAFALIGLHNLLHSANKNTINLKTLNMFLEPLNKIHKGSEVVQYSKKLLENERTEA